MDDFSKLEVASRRRFLKISGLSLLGGILLPPASSAAREASSNRKLSLYNIHTGENLDYTFPASGCHDSEALRAVDHFMRDHRTGEVHPIDPVLLDLLADLADHLESFPVFHIISGYRSASTNAQLRRHSSQVARKSYHLRGQALDIRMPAVDVARLHRAALGLERGGVGLYQGSGFVHVDTGPVRSW